MEHVNDWCFRYIYKGGLWAGDLYVCVHPSNGFLRNRSALVRELLSNNSLFGGQL